METPRRPFEKPEHTHIMNRLNAAEAFETFLQTKFVGQKRFSLEGGESVIPMLDAVLHEAAHDNLDEVDRKSTRLNSSHVATSYTVLCLKKHRMECIGLPQ